MVKIKTSMEGVRVAYGTGALPLKERTDLEIEELAEMALRSGDPSLIALFEEPLPTLDELLRARAERELPTMAPTPPADGITPPDAIDGGKKGGRGRN